MKSILLAVIVVVELLIAGCAFRVVSDTQLAKAVEFKDSMQQYPLKKPNSWLGDASKNFSFGEYQVSNFDSSGIRSKSHKEETIDVNLTRMLVNGSLIETVDNRQTDKYQRFAFTLSDASGETTDVKCKAYSSESSEYDSVFIYSSTSSSYLVCELNSQFTGLLNYQFDWPSTNLSLDKSTQLLRIQPEFDLIQHYKDGSSNRNNNRNQLAGFSIYKDNSGQNPAALISLADKPTLSLNHANSTQENRLFAALLMTQFYYADILKQFAQNH